MPPTVVTKDPETTLELAGSCELVITRRFAAPAALVFRALHEPQFVRRWWAPHSRGEMTCCEIDLRIGGVWRFQMRTSSGEIVGFHGEYLALEAPHRVVSTERFDPFPDAAAVVTLTLVEELGVTTMRQSSVYPSAEIRDLVLQTGMEAGMRESMAQLADVVSALGTTPQGV